MKKTEDMSSIVYVIKKLLALIIIMVISSILAEGIVIIAHYIMGYNVLNGEILPMEIMLLMKYYGYSIFILITIIYCKFIEKRSIKSMGFNKKVFDYLKGMLVGIILLVLSIIITILAGSISYHGIYKDINYFMIVLFWGAFMIQGAMEETLCRGFLMISLMQKISIPFAIFISSLVFMIPHFSSLFGGELIYSFFGIVNLFLVSIIFSLLIMNKKTIWIACGMHSFWNFCLFNIFGLNLSGTQKTIAVFNLGIDTKNILNGGTYGIEASAITTVVLSVYVGHLILKVRKIKCESIEI